MMSFWNLFFCRPNNPNSLSLFTLMRCSSPTIIFLVLLWAYPKGSMSYLCQRLQSWMQYSRWGSQYSRWCRGIESLPSTCWPLWYGCSPERVGLLPAGAHCLVISSFHPPAPPSPSQQGCFWSAHPPAWIDAGVCPHPGAAHWTWPCWTSWVLHGPLFKLFQVLLDDILDLWHVSSSAKHEIICKLVEGVLNPTVCVTDGDIKHYWS